MEGVPRPVDRVKLAIESLDSEGRGVARGPDGKVVFVEGALTGEVVEATVTRRKPSYDQARMVAILESSAGRREPRCPHFGVCGGCALQHAQMSTQVAAKQRELEENLARIGGVGVESMLPPLYGPEWGYRSRARLSARWVYKKGGALVGFRERKSSYVVDMRSCEVLPPPVSALIPKLRTLIDGLAMRERMPQIEVAVGDRITVLVFRNLDPVSEPDADALRRFADDAGVWIWLQPSGPDSAYPFHPESGPVLDYALPEFGLRIAFRPTDFTQVNQPVNRALVSRAIGLLDPQPGERIGDFFCGLGNFTLPIAVRGAQVFGVEGSEPLLRRAAENAAANGLSERSAFAVANLFGIEAEQVAAWGPFAKILIDPPREGAMDLVKALPDAWPQRIVYVSCDPGTLARDAGLLVNSRGFRLISAGVVNMFPHTAHVESLALFERET